MMKIASSVTLLGLVALVACVGDDPGPSSTNTNNVPDASVGDPAVPVDGGAGVIPDGADGPAVKIPSLRNPNAPDHPELGTAVRVTPGIVTGLKTTGATHGYFIQAPGAEVWGGVFVTVGSAAVTVVPGDVVTVHGVYSSYRGLDQIAADGTMKTGTASLPEPIVVAPADIAAGGARALELQSMLLRVEDVVASSATSQVDFGVRASGVTTGAVLYVTSFIANDVGASPFPATAGQEFSSITGFGYAFGSTDATSVPKLAPASASDLKP